MSLRFGILGAGGIVPPHLAAIAANPATEAVHLSDTRLDVAEKLAAQFNVPKVSADPQAVLDDPEVDAIVCALPTFLHSEWLARAALTGKHLLTEKPLCRTVTEGKALLELVERAGVALAVGYMRRFSTAREEVRRLVQSDALGAPVTWVSSSWGPRSDFYRGPANWMWDLTRGGGMVMDGSIHDFDFACWVLGKPKRLFAESALISDVVTAPTQASAVVKFDAGHSLSYTAAWQEGDFGAGGEPQRLVGPKGTLVLEGEWGFTWHDAPGHSRTLAWEPSDYFAAQLAAFLRLVQTGERDPRLASGQEALQSLWIAESIVSAGPEGASFKFEG